MNIKEVIVYWREGFLPDEDTQKLDLNKAIELVNVKKQDANIRAIVHGNTKNTWNGAFYFLAISNIILGTLTASAAFIGAFLGDIGTGIMALTAAIVTGLILFLRIPDKVATHENASKRFDSLCVQIDQVISDLNLDVDISTIELKEKLEEIDEDKKTIIAESPSITSKTYKWMEKREKKKYSNIL